MILSVLLNAVLGIIFSVWTNIQIDTVKSISHAAREAAGHLASITKENDILGCKTHRSTTQAVEILIQERAFMFPVVLVSFSLSLKKAPSRHTRRSPRATINNRI